MRWIWNRDLWRGNTINRWLIHKWKKLNLVKGQKLGVNMLTFWKSKEPVTSEWICWARVFISHQLVSYSSARNSSSYLFCAVLYPLERKVLINDISDWIILTFWYFFYFFCILNVTFYFKGTDWIKRNWTVKRIEQFNL